ncbi:SRC kinase signaling inhibitor 1 isoform X2 [Patella vulgata]|uniref:SRC kinase signaling inhibitor 1 isoform X2 n=1 Tax=Patella vulgata TaxID=6465 RepID=UPI00217FF15C|nr:SRC kinase signaling inhibitor 1 isoform X2 [Patella vulgata]
MIKSQSKGRIPVLKNGAEAEKPKSEASGKSESARPKLFRSRSKTDKAKDAEKSKVKPEKTKTTKEDKQKQKLEEKEKKKVKKEKEKPEKEKKKLFKSSERTQSKLLPKTKVTSPTKAESRKGSAIPELKKSPEEEVEKVEDATLMPVSSPKKTTPSPEPQYEVVASPKKKSDNSSPITYQLKEVNSDPKGETTPSISESLQTSSESIDTSLNDSVISYDYSKYEINISYGSGEDSSRADNCTPTPSALGGTEQSSSSSSQPQYYEDVRQMYHYQLTEAMSEEEREQPYDQVGFKECPRSPSARSDPGVLEDTPAKPNRIRYGPGRRQVPRRHTLGSHLLRQAGDIEDPEDKRAAFMELLAHRYPAYADRIYCGTQGERIYSGTQSELSYPIKQSRPRDPRRRQTTIVTYHPNRSLEYDDSGTMSDLDAPTNSFSRGGFQRSSLPIVRTPSSTLDRTLGLAFLVYGTETKKCLLPNEITTLDTVRALFVRAFPEKLSFEFLESPRQKIYILDPKTNIFFQLDDLSDVRDRAVLRIHECDSDKPQKLKDQPRVRGRAISAPPDRQAHNLRPTGHYGEPGQRRDDYAKVPAQPYHTLMVDGDNRSQWEVERRSRSRSRTPDPERPKSLPNRSRYSPDRHPTPERGLLGTIPEHHLIQNGRPVQNGGPYESVHYQRPQSQPTSPTRPSRPFSPNPTSYENPYYAYHVPPSGDYYQTQNGNVQTYPGKSSRAPANIPPHKPVPQQTDPRNGNRHPSSNRHSLAFAPMTTARPQPEGYYQRPARSLQSEEDDAFSQPRTATPVPEYYHSKKRIDKMEEQLANLAAWVHKSATDSLGRRSTSSNASESTETLPISSASKSVRLKLNYSGLSGISDGSSSQRTIHTITCSNEMKLSMVAIREKTCNLRLELRGLRRAQQVNYEDICDAINDTLYRIKKVLLSTPGACSQLIRQQRHEIDTLHASYRADQKKFEKDLSDLEDSVEELRNDVVSRQCRIQMSDIEAMALLLSNITKSIADLKARFPRLQERMKSVMAGEMEVVVTEEKFLKEEPDRIDGSLKRCKKLTGTLYTLKRLASVQDHRPLNVPYVASKTSDPSNEDKYGVLENIRAIVPNHTTRLNSLEEAENSRERKKKIIQQQESLKFGKTLELATKSLKPTEDYSKDNIKQEPLVASSSNKNIIAGKPNVVYSNQVTSGPVKSLPSHPQPQTTFEQKQPASTEVTMSAAGNAPPVVTSVPTMSVPVSPTTVASQDVVEINNQKLAARAAFFSSMSSPDSSNQTSPASSEPSPTKNATEVGVSPPRTTMDYVVKFTPAQISSIKADTTTSVTSSTGTLPTAKLSDQVSSYRPNNLTTKSPVSPGTKDPLSPTTKLGSNIPRPSGKTSPSSDPQNMKPEMEVKIKKQPPPPPPRKSSRLPLGSHNVNGTVSPVRAFSPESTPVEVKPSNIDSTHPVVYSSTPKPIPPKKPVSKYQKDLMAGIYANMNRPDLQSQKSPPQHEKLPSAPETKTNILLDREGSSDSTSSSTSLDSQIGGAVLRNRDSTGSNGSLSRKSKNKPNPPERRSSLLSNSPTRTTDNKTQLLQDQTLLLNQLQQQQTLLLQQHNNLVRSTNSPPAVLPKPTSPVASQNGDKK